MHGAKSERFFREGCWTDWWFWWIWLIWWMLWIFTLLLDVLDLREDKTKRKPEKRKGKKTGIKKGSRTRQKRRFSGPDLLQFSLVLWSFAWDFRYPAYLNFDLELFTRLTYLTCLHYLTYASRFEVPSLLLSMRVDIWISLTYVFDSPCLHRHVHMTNVLWTLTLVSIKTRAGGKMVLMTCLFLSCYLGMFASWLDS